MKLSAKTLNCHYIMLNSTKLSLHTNLNSILSQIYQKKKNSTAAKKDIIVQCCLIKMSTQIKHDKTFLPRNTEFDLNAKKKKTHTHNDRPALNYKNFFFPFYTEISISRFIVIQESIANFSLSWIEDSIWYDIVLFIFMRYFLKYGFSI